MEKSCTCSAQVYIHLLRLPGWRCPFARAAPRNPPNSDPGHLLKAFLSLGNLSSTSKRSSFLTAELEQQDLNERWLIMQPLRLRTNHVKVRTGCITCKERKVKCTEEKPNCSRCTRSGQQCGGYKVPRTWLFHSRKERAVAAEDSSIEWSPSWSCVLLPDETDRRSFDFYVDQTAPILSSYFGYSFWSRTLPQASFHEPVIKEMVLATSSLIESNELRLSLLEDNLVYQANYKRVIRRMTSDKAPSTEYVLMACLLLACCDFCRGEFQTGMQHIISGVRILDEWFRSQYLSSNMATPEANLILTELAPLFASIVLKIPTYGLSLGLHPGMMLKLVPCRELPHVPKTFSNVHLARHALDGIAHHVVKLMEPQTDMLEQGSWVPQMKDSLSRYSAALSAFEKSLPRTKRDRLDMWLALLRAHHRVLTMTVNVFPFFHGSPAAYEPFKSEFQAILEEYSKINMASPPNNFFSRPATRSDDSNQLQWHLGFIPPLFFVATKCRDPRTQSNAIRQLRSLKAQEKAWNSCIAATVVEDMLAPYHASSGVPSLRGQEEIGLPDCPCSDGIDWTVVQHLVEVCGYQGATMTLLARSICERV